MRPKCSGQMLFAINIPAKASIRKWYHAFCDDAYSSALLASQLTVFCIASAQAIIIGLTTVLECSVPHLRETHFVVPRTKWTVSAPVAILGPPVAALVIIWALCRQETWAWPIQDAMGLSMMLLILRQFRLPSIKVCCCPTSPLPALLWSVSGRSAGTIFGPRSSRS